MSMTCDYCQAATTDTYLCPNHRNRLRNTLHDLAEAWEDSGITLARQDRHATERTGSRSGSKHEQMAFNVNCSDVRTEVKTQVAFWAAQVGQGLMPGWLQEPWQQCRWLLSQVNRIAGMDFAGQMLRELEDELKDLHRSVDRPPDLIPAGQCDVCGHDLSAPMHAETALCPYCEVVVNVKEQREARINEARDMRYTAIELARLIPMICRVHITEKTIARWERQRVLKPNDLGMYRLGDVERLAEKLASRKATA